MAKTGLNGMNICIKTKKSFNFEYELCAGKF